MAIDDDDDNDRVHSVDSTMELDLPGEEKKKRWEAKAVAKSAGCSDSGSGWKEVEAVEREEEVEYSKV